MPKKTDSRLAPKDPYFAAENPKDLVAQSRLDTSLIPDTFLVELALAFYEGALKYGRYNWRMAPVKASVYFSAFDRHFRKFNAGEMRDKKTGTAHMGYVGCCAAIIHDAMIRGTMVDDRPPRGRNKLDFSAWLDGEVSRRMKKLQVMFESYTPRQFTIRDNFDEGKGVRSSPVRKGKKRRS